LREWLLMGERRVGHLGEFMELKRGYDLPTDKRHPGAIPIVSSSGPSGFHNEARVTGPGVVTGRYGTVGTVFYVKEDFWPLNTSLYVKDFKGNATRFIYYFLQTIDWESFNDKSGVPGINRNHVHEATVAIPALPEQNDIASLLGALDDKIELNRQTNETLEAIARVIFKDWFVDFGPTRAKAEGRPPYLAPELWDLFPDALDDEDTPEGWEIGTIEDVAVLNPESWSKKSPPDQIEYVDLANTKWGTIESTQAYEWDNAPSRAQRILRPGNTIVGTVRPGNGSYAFIGQDGLTGSTGFAVLAPRAKESREFVYLASTSAENIERLSHLADGAAYPAVRPDVVAATEVVLADEKAMAAFSGITAPLLDRMEANKSENITLAQIRDLLLPKLMSGEIRLREAEKLVEAVA
jgi:type I restriction enzyme S subunit